MAAKRLNLTKRDLVMRISSETGFTQQRVEQILFLMLAYITESLAQGHSIELRNFGAFRPKHFKARMARNPRKPEQTTPIPAHIAVKFKEGKELKARVRKLGTIPSKEGKGRP